MPAQHLLRLNFDETDSLLRRGEIKVCLIIGSWQNSPEPGSHPSSGVNFPCVLPYAQETLLSKPVSAPLTPPTPRSLGWFELHRALVGAGRPSTDHSPGEGLGCGGVALGAVFVVLPGSPDVTRAARTSQGGVELQ